MTLAVASALFIVLALTQKGLAYPYDVAMASTPDAARAEVLEHPASARAHIALLDRLKRTWLCGSKRTKWPSRYGSIPLTRGYVIFTPGFLRRQAFWMKHCER